MKFNHSISNEENRRILAKLRNWFTAAIKANDKPFLSVILEVSRFVEVVNSRLLRK